MTDKWLELNKESWDERAPINVRSEFYDNDAFKAGRSSLVNDELDTIGDVSGKTLLHLQCHFGQDTLSWARAGASVTGLDFSQTAITAARSLALELDINSARPQFNFMLTTIRSQLRTNFTLISRWLSVVKVEEASNS